MNTDLTEIDEVLRRVDRIVEWSLSHRSRHGYFAAMYYRMTAAIRESIVEGLFADGPRMVRFDSLFAEHYFRAFEAHRVGAPVVGPWAVTFQAVEQRHPLILQHLLLAMNAHINFDLALAVLEIDPDKELSLLKADYDQINAILAKQLNKVQASLNQISPLFGLVDVLGGQADEALASFSASIARDRAWNFARLLDTAEPSHRHVLIAKREATVESYARKLARPRCPYRVLLLAIRAFERQGIANNINILRQST